MYDELVKRLRTMANWAGISFLEESENVRTNLSEAADAIEELTAYVQQIEKLRKDGYYLQKTKMMTYGQATMTMPLPQQPKEETC
ncbi:MAG: hypothetical protein J6N19_13560 [Clostridium sp.]|nr:hypothetical protein [Clostridium sp.]